MDVFWGLEELMRTQTGVFDTEVGYIGGKNSNPYYYFHLGHAEAIAATYDTQQTSYETILNYFFRIHNPTTLNQQGNDVGKAYRSAIFYQNFHEKKQADTFIQKVNDSGRWDRPVVTTLEPFTVFYPAEDIHQDYLQKHPGGYTRHVERFDEY